MFFIRSYNVRNCNSDIVGEGDYEVALNYIRSHGYDVVRTDNE